MVHVLSQHEIHVYDILASDSTAESETASESSGESDDTVTPRTEGRLRASLTKTLSKPNGAIKSPQQHDPVSPSHKTSILDHHELGLPVPQVLPPIIFHADFGVDPDRSQMSKLCIEIIPGVNIQSCVDQSLSLKPADYQNNHTLSAIAATETKTSKGMFESIEAANGQTFGASRRGQGETEGSDDDSQSSASVIVAYSQPVAKVLSAPISKRSSRVPSRASSRGNSRSISPVSGAVVVASNQPAKHLKAHVVSSTQAGGRVSSRSPDRHGNVTMVSSNQPTTHVVSQPHRGNIQVIVNNQQHPNNQQAENVMNRQPNNSQCLAVNQTIINQQQTRHGVVQLPPPSQASTSQQTLSDGVQQHYSLQQQYGNGQQYAVQQHQSVLKKKKSEGRKQKKRVEQPIIGHNTPASPVVNGNNQISATTKYPQPGSKLELQVVREEETSTSESDSESEVSPRKQHEHDSESESETESETEEESESDTQPQRGDPRLAHQQNSSYKMVANTYLQQGGAEYIQSPLQGQMILSEEQRSNRPLHGLPAQHQLQPTPQKVNVFSPHAPVHFTIGK